MQLVLRLYFEKYSLKLTTEESFDSTGKISSCHNMFVKSLLLSGKVWIVFLIFYFMVQLIISESFHKLLYKCSIIWMSMYSYTKIEIIYTLPRILHLQVRNITCTQLFIQKCLPVFTCYIHEPFKFIMFNLYVFVVNVVYRYIKSLVYLQCAQTHTKDIYIYL